MTIVLNLNKRLCTYFLFLKQPKLTMNIFCTGCATELYLMAFTSTLAYAGTDDLPSLFVKLAGEEKSLAFYNHVGVDDLTKGKGDLWKFQIANFNFITDTCITKSDITGVTIHNGGDNGWNIESVVTVLHGGLSFDLLTANMDVNRWIDGNDLPSELKYDLTLV